MDDGLIRQRPYFVSQEIDGSFSGASIRPATRPTGVKQPQGDPIGAGLTVHVGPPPIGRQTRLPTAAQSQAGPPKST
jgi:hypothetical protein